MLKIKNSDALQIITTLPLIIVVGVIPITVQLKKLQLDGVSFLTWTGIKENYDYFSYYKSLLIIILTIISVLFFLLSRRMIKVNFEVPFKIHIPLAIYSLFVIISTFLSDFQDIALHGYNERYEGCIVIICYSILAVLTSLLIIDIKMANKIIFVICTSSIIVAIVGLFQFYGYDLFQMDLVQNNILHLFENNLSDKVEFVLIKDIMYATMYNPNYVGSYASLIMPLAFSFYLVGEKVIYKVFSGFLFCGAAFVLMIGSMSRAGIIGSSVAMLLLAVLLIKEFRKQLIYITGIVIYMVMLFTIMNISSSGRVISEFIRINPVLEGDRIEEGKQRLYIEDLQVGKNYFYIKTNTESLRMNYYDNSISFRDDLNKSVPISIDNENNVTFNDEKYNKYHVFMNPDKKKYEFYINDHLINLMYNEEKGFLILTPTGLSYYKTETKTFGFKGKELFASGRGFIWSRTIPLLKDTILIGRGPDTFTMYFPQYDIAGKINGLNNSQIVVDKPHNWYLQVATGTGVVSLIALLVFLGMYIFLTLRKILANRCDVKVKYLSAGILCSVIGYCVAGLFNDSVVSVAPVFWVVLGLGIAIYPMSSYRERHEGGAENQQETVGC